MKQVKIIISGEVQGIYFRAFIKDRASELGLTGYVKNLENHKIEVIAEGHELKLQKLVEHCKSGPPGAQIADVKINYLQYSGDFSRFKIKY